MGSWTQTRLTPGLDEVVYTLEDLADTSDFWQRYSFRGLKYCWTGWAGGSPD